MPEFGKSAEDLAQDVLRRVRADIVAKRAPRPKTVADIQAAVWDTTEQTARAVARLPFDAVGAAPRSTPAAELLLNAAARLVEIVKAMNDAGLAAAPQWAMQDAELVAFFKLTPEDVKMARQLGLTPSELYEGNPPRR